MLVHSNLRISRSYLEPPDTVTEIPEHLLKRSKAAKGGSSGGDSGDSSGSSAVEAVAETAAPEAAGPKALVDAAAAIPADKPAPVPDPDPPYIAAAKARKKMPMWAMGLVAAVPLWAIFYAGTMQLPEVEDPLFIDAAIVYQEGGCAGCHGGGGGGGSGYQLSEGEVLATFPAAIDQMLHVARGSAVLDGAAYGSPDRPGGQRLAGARGVMPAQLSGLSMLELELVIFHERAVLSGEDMTTEAYEEWMEHLRERIESGELEGPAIDLELLLACADPAQSPGATGVGSDDEEHPCPGPHAEGEEVAAGE